MPLQRANNNPHEFFNPPSPGTLKRHKCRNPLRNGIAETSSTDAAEKSRLA